MENLLYERLRKKYHFALVYFLLYGGLGFHRFYLGDFSSKCYGSFLLSLTILAFLTKDSEISKYLSVLIQVLLFIDLFLTYFALKAYNKDLLKKIASGEIKEVGSDLNVENILLILSIIAFILIPVCMSIF